MKYKNETQEVNGVKVRSKLEKTCYELLVEHKIPFEYEPITYNLLTPFKYTGDSYEKVGRGQQRTFGKEKQAVRGVTYTPDFVGDGWIIETKGMETSDFKIKWKMFKKLLEDSGQKVTLYKPTNKKEILETISLIKTKSSDHGKQEPKHDHKREDRGSGRPGPKSGEKKKSNRRRVSMGSRRSS